MLVNLVLNRPTPKLISVLTLDWVPQRHDVLDVGSEPPESKDPDQEVPCLRKDGRQHVLYRVRQVVHHLYTSEQDVLRGMGCQPASHVSLFVDVLGEDGSIIPQPQGNLPGMPHFPEPKDNIPRAEARNDVPAVLRGYLVSSERVQEILGACFTQQEKENFLTHLREQKVLQEQWADVYSLIKTCEAYCRQHFDAEKTRTLLAQLLDHEQLPITLVK